VRLLRLFACAVLGRWDDLVAARRAAIRDEPNRAWREALLMVHVYAGAPRAVECHALLEREGGLGMPEPGEVEGETVPRERGEALFDAIYARQAGEVRALLGSFHPDFARVVFHDCYARILARPGLSTRMRELLAVAALAATGQPRQLASHARGALRCGAAPDEVDAALAAIADLLEPARLDEARGVVARLPR
jgi:alkylhydroperoxidase/carboxymuconolactone decarboxylase family protein YurZ